MTAKRNSRLNHRPLLLASLILVGLLGATASLMALWRTDDDPVSALLSRWPAVVAAGILYATGMCVYALSWAALFPKGENRTLLALSFLISQPVKYLPGGVAQPISQVTLAAQSVESSRRAIVAFPVHVLLNVVAAMTLASPILIVADVAPWIRWLVVLVPLLWAALDRRWMTRVLALLGRVHRVFRVSNDLPIQRHITRAFVAAVVAHGLMFVAFAVLSDGLVPGWSVLGLSVAYGLAWLVGYVALPAPAGLGAREAILALLLGASISTSAVLKVSAIHRILTLVVELGLLAVAFAILRTTMRKTRRRRSETGTIEAVEGDRTTGELDNRR